MNYKYRATVGFIVGSVNILGFTATLIYVITVLCDFTEIKETDKKRYQDVISNTVTLLYIILFICLTAIIFSSLLIVGIKKKRHFLMRPWLICAFAGIVCHTFRITVGFFYGCFSDDPFDDILLAFIVGLLILGLQILIFHNIYKLYKVIQDMNNGTQSTNEREETALNAANDNPPSYAELERNDQINK